MYPVVHLFKRLAHLFIVQVRSEGAVLCYGYQLTAVTSYHTVNAEESVKTHAPFIGVFCLDLFGNIGHGFPRPLF